MNGKFLPAGEPVLYSSNRSYRYGDGFFETMRVENSDVMLWDYHYERLSASLNLLQFKTTENFSRAQLYSDVLELCKKNNCSDRSRIRLSIYRGNGGLLETEQPAEYLIESDSLNISADGLNEKGLHLGVYSAARKALDTFSNLKSASFQPYAMAVMFAKQQQLNDCIVLNSDGHVADTTRANIFIVKNSSIYTPALYEGCVNGVMRRHLLSLLKKERIEVVEKTITVEEVEKADEVFLTNAIRRIQWVEHFHELRFSNTLTKSIYSRFFERELHE